MTAGTSPRATRKQPWHLYLPGLAALGVILLATTELGTPSTATRTSRQVVSVQKGVVQATTSGSGNISAGTDVTVNFNTGGTLAKVYVRVGQAVRKGQLLATLDTTAARLTLMQAEKTLIAADDQLSSDESRSSSSSTSLETTGTSATQFVSDTIQQNGTASASSTSMSATSTTTTTAPSTGASSSPTTTPTSPTTTSTAAPSPARTSPSTSTSPARTTPQMTTSPAATAPSTRSAGGSAPAAGASGSTTGGSGSAAGSTVTASTIATDQASVYSAQASVRNAEISLAATSLSAPTSGTVISLESLSPGDTVSSGSSSASSGGTSSSGAGPSSSGTSAGGLGSSSSSSTSTSSSSGFAEIVNTHRLTMTVAFSESDISKIKVGQPATVTLDAISGLELGAHVTAISAVGTTSSSVVSYDATLTLDQGDTRVKPGMSASAAVITGQGYGVNVAGSAVSGSGSLATVSLLKGGKTVAQPVVVGLKGDNRTQIVSGLRAGDQLVVTTALPSTGSGSSSASSLGRAGGALGRSGGGIGGGGFGGGGGGFPGGGPPGGGGG